MIIIASDAAGSGMQFVRPGVNGYVFPTEGCIAPTGKLLRVATLQEQELDGMSSASRAIACQFRPSYWAVRAVAIPEGVHAR